MKSFLVVVLIILLCLFSCSKNEQYQKKNINGVEAIFNKNIPSDKNFKIDLKDEVILDLSKQDTLNQNFSLSRMSDVILDKVGNIYVLDDRKSKIFKFDSTGEFKKEFGNKGSGPGEFINTYPGRIAIIDNTLYVTSRDHQKVVKFDLDGNSIGEKRFDSQRKFPRTFKKTGKYICGNIFTFISDTELERELGLFDSNFDLIQTFYKDIYDMREKNLSVPEEVSLAVSSTNDVYVPEYSTNSYKINVFDMKGNKKSIIQKNYRAVPYSQKELDDLKDLYGQYQMNVTGKMKNAIEYIQLDKFDRLWVLTAMCEKSNTSTFDVFKDGIFLNSVELGNDSTTFAYFMEDKLMFIDFENTIIKFYNY
ncbi:MAG: 6-bladed beta-propeller [Candidatus Delongbacteria bacterium]|nr:6-bladed beta-propeller [Candidatus Delongbacteria bacterium]